MSDDTFWDALIFDPLGFALWLTGVIGGGIALYYAYNIPPAPVFICTF